MSNLAMTSDKLEPDTLPSAHVLRKPATGFVRSAFADLPAAITKAASKQTYYTIRFLVDQDRINNAYRAYGYFRWVDDWLDMSQIDPARRLAFIERQRSLINDGYQGCWPSDLTTEENMLLDLIRSDDEPNSGLQAYIRHMLAVMTFDAHRRGRLISQQELADYTQHLAIGVTEAMHYFIGHDEPSPHTEARYLAVSAAHITHMLRDTYEDMLAGYYNIPLEFVTTHGIDVNDVYSNAYREWVKGRVQLARAYFEAGRDYLVQTNRRCRMAGYAYVARFTGVLAAIEREGYLLRPTYPERKSIGSILRMSKAILSGLFTGSTVGRLVTP